MLILRQIPHKALGDTNYRFTLWHVELGQYSGISNDVALNYILV
jgi:hypothetical protein